MWEFQVRTGMEKRFEQGYGAKGDWARFFGQDDAFIGTELVHDKGERTYVTLDFWTSQRLMTNSGTGISPSTRPSIGSVRK